MESKVNPTRYKITEPIVTEYLGIAYAIRNSENKWYRTNGYERAQTGNSYNQNWVEEIANARLFQNESYAKGVVTSLRKKKQEASLVKIILSIS